MIRHEALLTLPLIAALLLSGPGTAGANSPAPKPEELRKAQTLVRRLGAPDFRVREQATRELFKMGLASKQALLEGSRNDDGFTRGTALIMCERSTRSRRSSAR